MPSTDGVIIKKVLPIIYVIDTSGSMSGERLATVNAAMRECEQVLRDKASDSPDNELKIGALTFSSGAEWLTKTGLVSLEDFYWNDAKAGGVTDLGAALNELNDKLSRSAFLKSETGCCVPVIIFMSDGCPTDSWEKSLAKISAENRWFASARKIAIAIGEDADTDILKKLVGNVEAVVRSNDLETLQKLIVAVSASASMLAGKSRLANDEASGGEILDNALTEVEGDVEIEKDTAPVDEPAPPPVDTGDGWSDDDWS